MKFTIIEHGGREYDLAVALRHKVLREPLGLKFSAEKLSAESTATHIAGWIDDDEVKACCVVFTREDRWHQICQVTVDFDLQRQGLGTQLMEYAHQHVMFSGGSKIFCHARDVARAFYKRLGYRTVGPPFVEVSIEHVRMETIINRQSM